MDSDGTLLKKLCGTDSWNFQSSGNMMMISFHSDYFVAKRGFKASWRKIEGRGGNIISPNHPHRYPNNFENVSCPHSYTINYNQFEMCEKTA